MTKDSFSNFHSLPAGTCLHNTYRIQKTIGAGGFGITYMGIHTDTGNVVAIKEYFPPSLAVRNKQEGLNMLRPFPDKNIGIFQKGLRRFLNEANILKSFQDLESIVTVYDLFEENGTAYLVMEYIDGLTLSRYVSENGTLTFPEISELIAPVIHSLSKIHGGGLIHRDISPDNLILGTDNKLHLIDFGAASYENAGNTQNTIILKAGYAPPEQYISNGRIGAWIDVYSICATMYFALTGNAPAEAIHRLDSDSPHTLENLSLLLPWQYAILEKGLQLRPADRFQNVEELYSALTGTAKEVENATILQTAVSKEKQAQIRKLYGLRRNAYRPVLLSCLGIAILAALIIIAVSSRTPAGRQNTVRQPSGVTAPAISVPTASSPAIRATPAATNSPKPKKPTGTNSPKPKKSAGTNSPKPKKSTGTTPDYKVKGDDGLTSIPLE